MEKNIENLQNLEKEYSVEIRQGVPEIQSFYNLGITAKDFVAEIILREVYGDEDLKTISETETMGEKNIAKVEEMDIALSKVQMEQANLIDEDPFNAELDAILAKLG